ncbi:MAG: thioredoxin [Actinomycetota bacterium]|nr:thioredoxin [Actinomycetota bacterium]
MADNITHVSDETFDEQVALSELPVLVDFWAEWCGPCKVIAPVLEEIAGDKAGKLKVVKLNVDENPRTAQRFQVMSIPTLLLFKGGKAQSRIVGARPKGQILAEVEPHLSAR